jgi:hypothetical protein
MSYLHKDYAFWSSRFPVIAGKALNLSRGHYFHDVKTFEIRDGQKTYEPSIAELGRFHAICDGRANCYLTYYGSGRLQVSSEPTDNISYEMTRSGSEPPNPVIHSLVRPARKRTR